MNNMEIVWKRVGEIKPYDKNPRINDEAVEFVANSIREFGWRQPIVVDKDGVIIAGHTRYKAAQVLNHKEVPVLYADLTSDQVKAYRLADNKTGEIATWDIALLDIELDPFKDEDMLDMADFGFLDTDEGPEIIEDEFDESLAEQPKAVAGDIYICGEHRVMCTDSTSSEEISKLIYNKQADLILTDPPYNVDYEGATKDKLKIKNDKMKDGIFLQFLTDAFSVMNEFSKLGAAIYVFHADSEGYNFRTAFKNAGYNLRQCLVWLNNSMVIGRQDYQWKHEPILYGWKDGASHSWYSDRKQTTIIEFDKPQRNTEHPTMKPVGLCGYLIGNSSKEGDIVLDTFGGSGSTLIACAQLGRVCYTSELDPRYIDVIVKRYLNFTSGEKEVALIRDGETTIITEEHYADNEMPETDI